jgi:hypothetical protein
MAATPLFDSAVFDDALFGGSAGLFDGAVFDPALFDEGKIGVRVHWAQLQVPAAGAVTGTQIKAWNGSSWVTGALKRWNGSAWEDAALKRWDGAVWVSA